MTLAGTKKMQLDDGRTVETPVYCCSKCAGSFEIVGYVRTMMIGKCRLCRNGEYLDYSCIAKDKLE